MDNNKELEVTITGFAYKTAKSLEDFIRFHNEQILTENQLLQAKILDFYQKLEARSFKMDDGEMNTYDNITQIFKATFNIETKRHGEI
jgi:hypothetical protein